MKSYLKSNAAKLILILLSFNILQIESTKLSTRSNALMKQSSPSTSTASGKSSGTTKVSSSDTGTAMPIENDKSNSSLKDPLGNIQSSAYNNANSFQEAEGQVVGQTVTLGNNKSEMDAQKRISSSESKHSAALKSTITSGAGGGGTTAESGSQITDLNTNTPIVKQSGSTTSTNSITGNGTTASATEGGGNTNIQNNDYNISAYSKTGSMINVNQGEGDLQTLSNHDIGSDNVNRQTEISLQSAGNGINNSNTKSENNSGNISNKIDNKNSASGVGLITNTNTINHLQEDINDRNYNKIKNENTASGMINIVNNSTINNNDLDSNCKRSLNYIHNKNINTGGGSVFNKNVIRNCKQYGTAFILNENQSDGDITNVNFA